MGKEITANDEEIIAEYERQIQAAQQQYSQSQPYSPAMFAGQQKQNLVEWQLDFRTELMDIERLLRSDVLIRDKDGNEIWIKNPNHNFVLFNELGVSDITREIRMFLNKNKVLSNYKLDEIKPRVKMLGHELRVLIYNNQEMYGMDNEYKRNNFSIVVLTLMSMIEDCYRRALNGEERRDLNQARIVNQSEPMMPINNSPMMVQGNNNNQKKWYNPFTWSR